MQVVGNPDLEASGVYFIKCIANDVVYVGSTIRDFKRRLREHWWYLRNGTHRNSRLQRAYDKYGDSAFRVCVSWYAVSASPEEIIKAERLVLDAFEHTGETFNTSTPGLAPDTTGFVLDSNARNYPTFVNVKTGERLEAGKNLKQACKMFGLCHKAMNAVKKGQRPHHKGWAVESGDYANGVREPNGNAKRYPAFVNVWSGKIIPAGVDLSNTCRKQGLHQGNMCLVVGGDRNHHKGWALADSDYAKARREELQ